jgi:hypothetical protein
VCVHADRICDVISAVTECMVSGPDMCMHTDRICALWLVSDVGACSKQLGGCIWGAAATTTAAATTIVPVAVGSGGGAHVL